MASGEESNQLQGGGGGGHTPPRERDPEIPRNLHNCSQCAERAPGRTHLHPVQVGTMPAPKPRPQAFPTGPSVPDSSPPLPQPGPRLPSPRPTSKAPPLHSLSFHLFPAHPPTYQPSPSRSLSPPPPPTATPFHPLLTTLPPSRLPPAPSTPHAKAPNTSPQSRPQSPLTHLTLSGAAPPSPLTSAHMRTKLTGTPCPGRLCAKLFRPALPPYHSRGPSGPCRLTYRPQPRGPRRHYISQGAARPARLPIGSLVGDPRTSVPQNGSASARNTLPKMHRGLRKHGVA